MKELILHKNASAFNILGLRKGQSELYAYMLQCTKLGKPCELMQMIEIYHTHVRPIENHRNWDGTKWVHWKEDGIQYIRNYIERCRKDGRAPYLPNQKQWIRMTVGSLVMRGLLSVIPKFDPETIKE
jgi:hypothetical protein